MTILHYTIGLPPRRRGGSVKYAYDLMQEQARQGQRVLALTCGDTLFRGSKTKIKYMGREGLIDAYCLTNPLTPTLIYGVSDPDSQHRDIKVDEHSILNFIDENHIAILHLHTFMGIHSDVVRVFKDKGVKIVYTTHDFHGICPHYNLINEKGKLCNDANGINCARCNLHEPSDLFLRLASSNLFQKLKRKLKKKPKIQVGKNPKEDSSSSQDITSAQVVAFERLLEYYRLFFSLIDTFHFNSFQSREKFEYYLGSLHGRVIPVFTKEITDRRRELEPHEKITLGFIGAPNDYKGFPMLKQVVGELYEEGIRNIKIRVYGSQIIGIDRDCPTIEYCGTYNYSDISDVLYHLDGTIVPSKWYETFSLVTLESLAHGRPAIVSDHVGAKDIVKEITPELIFSSKDELKEIVKRCIDNPNYLPRLSRKILSADWKYSLSENVRDMLNLYQEQFL